MSDQSISPFDTIELINLFIQKYNVIHQVNDNFFQNVDEKDPSATNDQMELFYSYIKEYQELQNENIDYIDVYEPSNNISGSDHCVYALVELVELKNTKILYISRAYISLLYIAYKTINKDIKWNIIKL